METVHTSQRGGGGDNTENSAKDRMQHLSWVLRYVQETMVGVRWGEEFQIGWDQHTVYRTLDFELKGS